MTQAPARTPRVLFLDHTAELGGGEIALLRLLSALDRRRFAPSVILASDGPLRTALEERGIQTRVLPLSRGVVHTRKDTLGASSLLRFRDAAASLSYMLRLARFLRSERIDLLHCNSLKADLLGGFAARRARVPSIWHVRDRIEPDYLPPRVVAVFRALARRVPRYIIANSQATLATLHLPSSARASVVYDGMEFGEAPRDSRPGAEPLIGLVGRIAPWKGQDVFLRAARQVHDAFPNVRFQVIGGALFGEEANEADIRRLAATLGVDSCVEFTGFRPDVADLIGRLDVLVHASTVPEPFGQVIVEGMAAGRPVVATNAGGVPEIVEDGVTGLLVAMGDPDAMAAAISRLLADPEAALEMGRRGFARARERFSIEETARAVEKVYDGLLGSL